MLIQESYHDVPTTADGQGTMRMYPNLPAMQPSINQNAVLTTKQAFMSSTPQSQATRTPASQVWSSSARSTKVGPIPIAPVRTTNSMQ